MIRATIPTINRPIPNIINPILGWNLSQEIDTDNINKGKAKMRVVINMEMFMIDFKNPPMMGMYPSIIWRGEKKVQIESTSKI